MKIFLYFVIAENSGWYTMTPCFPFDDRDVISSVLLSSSCLTTRSNHHVLPCVVPTCFHFIKQVPIATISHNCVGFKKY